MGDESFEKGQFVCIYLFSWEKKVQRRKHARSNVCSYRVFQPGFLRTLSLKRSQSAAASFWRCKPRAGRVRGTEAGGEGGTGSKARCPVTAGCTMSHGQRQQPPRRPADALWQVVGETLPHESPREGGRRDFTCLCYFCILCAISQLPLPKSDTTARVGCFI